MATLASLKVQLLANVKGFQASMARAGESVKELVGTKKNLDRQLRRVERSANSLGRSMLIGVTLPVLGVGAAAIKAAADAEELDSKFNAVFKDLSAETLKWAATQAGATNRSVEAYKSYLATLQDTFVPLGFAREAAAGLSKKLVTLAVDLASFNNQSEPEVVRNLTSAIVGNMEAVRSYGIIITQAVLNQELLNMGIQGGVTQATEQEKVMARLAVIMRSTSDAQGDAARTADSFTNQLRGLMAAGQDVLIAFGNELLPVAAELIGFIKDGVRWVGALTNNMKQWAISIAAGAAVMGPFLIILGTIAGAFVFLGGPITIVLALLGALVGWFVQTWVKGKLAEAQLRAMHKRVLELDKAISSMTSKSTHFMDKLIKANKLNELSKDLDAVVSDLDRMRKAGNEGSAAFKILEKTAAAIGKRIEDLNRPLVKAGDLIREAGLASRTAAGHVYEEGEAYRDLAKAVVRAGDEMKKTASANERARAAVLANTDGTEAGVRAYLAFAEAVQKPGAHLRKLNEDLKEVPGFFGGIGQAFGDFRKNALTAAEAGKLAFNGFASATVRSLDDTFFSIVTGKFENLKEVVKNFGISIIRVFTDIAAKLAAAKLFEIGESAFGFAKNILDFAEGGLVNKPTLGVLGEAGPELVVPLAKIGGRQALQDIILSAELAKAGVGPTAFPIAEGIDAASAAAANASIAQATSIALAKTAAILSAALSVAEFLKSNKDTADVAQLGVEGATAAAAFALGSSALLAPLAIGKIFESGIPQAAANSIAKFTKKHIFGKGRNTDEQSGLGNVRAIRNNPLIPQLGLDAEDLIRRTGGNPSFVTDILNDVMRSRGLALNEFGQIGPAGQVHVTPFAKGGIVTMPTLALLGESGPEAVIPLNRAGGGMRVTIDMRGALISDDAALQRFVRKIRIEIEKANLRTFSARGA